MKKVINEFIRDKNLALIGVSSNPAKFGNMLVKELASKGYTIYPVHPNLEAAEGVKCFKSIDDLPSGVENLLLVVRPEATESIVASLSSDKIKRVWMHRGMGKGSASHKAVSECNEKGIDVVYGFCPMMFLAPSGFHRFHLWMRKNFGKVPAEYGD